MKDKYFLLLEFLCYALKQNLEWVLFYAGTKLNVHFVAC